MLGVVKMLGGVLVLRRIAAPDVAANEAQAQMHPGVAHLQALLATVGVRLHVFDLVEMCAFGHDGVPLRIYHCGRIGR
jgi:hypothetical protein